MSAERTLAEWASYYRFLGWSVFPLGIKDKKPHFELLKKTGFVNADGHGTWKPFSEKLASEDLVERWWAMEPSANIGLACGKVSGVTVIDIDFKPSEPTWIPAEEVEEKLKTRTRSSITGSGGMHLFCKYVEEMPNQSDKRVHPQIDIRNDGGYVVLAPSIHPDGPAYRWKTNEAEDMADFPEIILSACKDRGIARKLGAGGRNVTSKDEWARIFNGVKEKVDGRNYASTKVIGKLQSALVGAFGNDPRFHRMVWLCTLAVNSMNEPPLPEEELRTVFKHIIKHPYGE